MKGYYKKLEKSIASQFNQAVKKGNVMDNQGNPVHSIKAIRVKTYENPYENMVVGLKVNASNGENYVIEIQLADKDLCYSKKGKFAPRKCLEDLQSAKEYIEDSWRNVR
jgi:hypothetical protein